MEESGRVLGKGRIRASIETASGRLPEKSRMSVISEKLKNPGEYKVESVRVSKMCPGEFPKMVESVWVPKNGRIQASLEK